MALSCSVIVLLLLKIIISELIEDLVIDSENLKFVSRYTVYEDNNLAIVVAKIPKMNHASKHIDVRYHWFRHQFEKESVIRKIKSKNQKVNIFTNGLQGEIF